MRQSSLAVLLSLIGSSLADECPKTDYCSPGTTFVGKKLSFKDSIGTISCDKGVASPEYIDVGCGAIDSFEAVNQLIARPASFEGATPFSAAVVCEADGVTEYRLKSKYEVADCIPLPDNKSQSGSGNFGSADSKSSTGSGSSLSGSGSSLSGSENPLLGSRLINSQSSSGNGSNSSSGSGSSDSSDSDSRSGSSQSDSGSGSNSSYDSGSSQSGSGNSSSADSESSTGSGSSLLSSSDPNLKSGNANSGSGSGSSLSGSSDSYSGSDSRTGSSDSGSQSDSDSGSNHSSDSGSFVSVSSSSDDSLSLGVLAVVIAVPAVSMGLFISIVLVKKGFFSKPVTTGSNELELGDLGKNAGDLEKTAYQGTTVEGAKQPV